MDTLVGRIEHAFASRPHPGGGAIARCAYDRAHGGAFDGPCWECAEMAAFFADRPWPTVSAVELRRYGDNDALFTVEAYCYYLPAYLIAAIRDPRALDVCVEHLSYRFGPKPEADWGRQRLRAVLDTLSREEQAVTHAYFEEALAREPEDFDGFIGRALANLET